MTNSKIVRRAAFQDDNGNECFVRRCDDGSMYFEFPKGLTDSKFILSNTQTDSFVRRIVSGIDFPRDLEEE